MNAAYLESAKSNTMNKSQLITILIKVHQAFWETAAKAPNPTVSRNNKWSVYENTVHINIGLKRAGNYLALSKSDITTLFGLSGRKSATHEAFTITLNETFSKGVKATPAFIPEANPDGNLTEVIDNGQQLLNTLIITLENWSEEDLETYYCPNPALGKITAREMLYFMVYHTRHHHKTIANG